jgi:acyl carrier protein
VDIAVEKEVKDLIQWISETLPPLTGIFHLAMLLEDAFIIDVSREKFKRVTDPKVAGALNLHKYTKHLPLEHFICMSSLASLVGNAGQIAYVSANAFLDAFAHYRVARGLAATTVNLGILAETGALSRNSEVASLLKDTGIKGLGNEETLAALRVIIEQKPVQIGLFEIDWHVFARAAPQGSSSSRIRSLTGKGDKGEGIPPRLKELFGQLIELSQKDRQEFMEQVLSEIFAKIVGIAPGKVDRNRRINLLGVDSIMVVEFARAIYKQIEFEISPVELLSGPTISQFALSLIKRFALPVNEK